MNQKEKYTKSRRKMKKEEEGKHRSKKNVIEDKNQKVNKK